MGPCVGEMLSTVASAWNSKWTPLLLQSTPLLLTSSGTKPGAWRGVTQRTSPGPIHLADTTTSPKRHARAAVLVKLWPLTMMSSPPDDAARGGCMRVTAMRDRKENDTMLLVQSCPSWLKSTYTWSLAVTRLSSSGGTLQPSSVPSTSNVASVTNSPTRHLVPGWYGLPASSCSASDKNESPLEGAANGFTRSTVGSATYSNSSLLCVQSTPLFVISTGTGPGGCGGAEQRSSAGDTRIAGTSMRPNLQNVTFAPKWLP
mmetsp:Transcript_8638/g.30654  ORF Transcript_8638/g.30654 Transcript_8638/m.30654 type:complete len:259 (+) Transcript_8638:2574-3350(+)